LSPKTPEAGPAGIMLVCLLLNYCTIVQTEMSVQKENKIIYSWKVNKKMILLKVNKWRVEDKKCRILRSLEFFI
jgi:hypothetical protein